MNITKTHSLTALALLISSFSALASETWSAAYDNPKSFIENKGQFNLPKGKTDKVLFAVDDQPSVIYFTANGVAYTFAERTRKPKEKYKPKTNESLEKKQNECNTTT